MRMKNSRSSTTDRSREPILKKPRLVEGEQQDRTSNDVRQLPQRVSTPAGPGSGPTVQRFRAKEEDEDTERDNSLREAYQQQQQELVRDYKNGLAELTFNSKPIITNLSIIAGENLQAAKGIAAAISSNIIEVPADQKLPSLYLLDSIVKNIGRDYIKHFASRLPEVFCKAYRQVDSAMRNSMRHLFGTWRKVFPPACLQIIEKELDFAPVMNDSSSGLTPARSDSQSQRQTHSIHVNPKYLETRQRLQPLDRAMTSNDSTGTKVTSDDAERPDKVAVFGAGRPWANMSTKMNNNARLQREVPSQHINEKIPGAAYSDHNYISDSPTRMDLRAGISERVGERGVTNNALYGAESITLKSTAAQRNAFGSKNGFANDGVSRSAQFAAQLQPTQGISNRNSAGISKNWKNSEEEEFMWDDVKSKLTESNILKKEVWAPDDSKKQVLDDHFTRSNGEHDIWSRVHRGTSTDSVSIAQSRETSFGKRVPSTWPSQDTHPVDGLNNVNVASRKPGKAEGFSTTLSGSTSMIPSSARVGLQPHTEPSVSGAPSFGSLVNLLSGSGGAFIQQGKHPLISTSLSVDSQSQNMSEQIYQQDQYFPEIYKRPPQHGGKLRLDPRLQTTNDAYSVLPNHILPGTTQHLEQDLQTSTSFMRSARGHQVQESQSEPTQSRPFGQAQKPSNESSNCGTTSVSTKDSLLAAIMKSGLLSSHSLTGNLPNLNLQDSRSLPLNMNLSHSEPSEPPPRIATSSKGTVGLASVLSPPTAPGPPAHSLSSNASELADVTKSVGNPLSSLLSSLVAKGLISASSTESETERAPQVPDPLENKRQHLGRSSSTEAFTDPVSSTIPSSSGSELPVLKPASKNTIALSDVAMTEKTDLIGVEFRPDIIRELHPPVISSLFEDLLHQCSKCGARVRYQDQLDRHLELHNLKEHENSSSKRVSRTWFKRSEDWVSGKMEPSREVLTETSTDPLVKPDDKSEPVVPAVESQSACVICGEPFEDSYSHERDEWMYRGAVYLTIPAGGGKDGVTDESDAQGPIVHPNCISSSSAYELGLI